MINRMMVRRRLAYIAVVLLTIPFIGWTAHPKSTYEGKPIPKVTTSRTIALHTSLIGNAERGQDFFMGRLHFENEGPPCMGCHNIGANGLLGGGAMGPDLTDILTRRTPTEIAGILSNSGPILSPVMQPIFTEHPLTNGEQADLVAFMEASMGQPGSNKEILVIGISFAGFLAAVAVLGFLYRGRLRGVRKALIRNAQARK
jgi:hypothetical protein